MDTYKKLRVYNGVMVFLHLIQGVVILMLTTDFSLPVMTNYLKFDVATQTLLPNQETLFDRQGFDVCSP